MTTIRLHGILAQKYGKVFKMNIDKPRDVIRAIDVNREGFRKTVVDLQKQGFSYELIVNKKRLSQKSFLDNKYPKEIDFVPFIVGSGPGFVPALILTLLSAAIQYALTDPGTIDGGETTIGSDSKSLLFSSSIINLTAQGSPLPIGYGRLKVGSSVIQSSMKSIPQTVKTSDAMQSNNYAPETEEGVFNQESNIEISNPSLY
jgi:predicted phage tail protein